MPADSLRRTRIEQFVILTSTGLSGSFADDVITDGSVIFNVLYSPSSAPNDVVLNATTVPEPTSFALVAFGLVLTAAVGGREQREMLRED